MQPGKGRFALNPPTLLHCLQTNPALRELKTWKLDEKSNHLIEASEQPLAQEMHV